MLRLDVAGLLGCQLGKELRATSVAVVMDRIVVVGTDAGCVLAFSQPGDEVGVEDAGVCVYAQTLHHGPVYALCASTAHLFASAGYDAAPVVQPVLNLLTNGAENVRRLSGHTLPVTAMAFFSTGSWLVTCGVGGRFIVFDAVTCLSLCDLSVGFSLRCLSLSPDETTCFVGGTRLARIDLYDNDRPAEPLAQREPPSWLQHYSWSCDGGSFAADSPDDLFIARLVVTPDDITAIFRQREDCRATSGAIATWSHSAADFWLSRDFRRVEGELPAGAEFPQPPFSQILLKEEAKKDTSPPPRAHDGWDTWPRASVRVERVPSLLPAADVKLDDDDAPVDCLESEEERGRALQAECDELVCRLKVLMRQGKRKLSRASMVV